MDATYKPVAQVRLRDARRETRLAARLRAMPEPRRLRFVRRLLRIEADVALQLANRSIHDRATLELLFAETVRQSNPSTIPAIGGLHSGITSNCSRPNW